MNFHDNYYRTGKKVEKVAGKPAKMEFFNAILEYYFEGVEPEFDIDAAELAFAGVEWSLRKARAGMLGGKASRRAEGEAKSEACQQADCRAMSQANLEAEVEASQQAHGEECVQAEAKADSQANGELVPVPVPVTEEKDKKEIPFAEIVRYLNSKTGKNFKASSDATRQLIGARFAEGFTLDDFKAAIDNQCSAWLCDPKMQQYLKPSTLFQKTKFEGYVNARPKQQIGGGGNLGKYDD